MRRRCCSHFLLLSSIMLLLAVAQATKAQDGPDRFWRPYAEIGARGGDVLEAGRVNMFLPVYQSEVNILFADLCGGWTDARSQQGNLGLAFRQMLINDWIFGIHSSYDIRHSEYGNNFHRATLGLELLNPNWGVRWNGYLSGDDPELINSLNQARVVDNNLFVQQAAERAYSGQDVELEMRVWGRNGPSEEAFHDWMTFYDVELWAAIGVYNYDADAVGFESMTGPRSRLELRIFDLPYAGPDSRLVFAGQFENDDVRGDVTSASMVVRIPFGRGTRNPRGRLRGLNRRMVAPLVRQKEIITVAGAGPLERAAFTKTGEEISQVVAVNPGTAGVEGVISGAGANSLVLADGGTGGVITTGGPINLSAGQTILGGGGTISVSGVNSGATVAFTAPGARPLFDSGANTTFVAADNSCIVGVDMRTTGAGQSGVFLDGVTGVFMQDIGISTAGAGAHGIVADGASQFDLLASLISTSGDGSDGLQLLGDSEARVIGTAFSTSGIASRGLFATDTSFLDMQDSLIFTTGTGGSEGIRAEGSSQLSVRGSVVTTTSPATDGISAEPSAGTDVLSMSIASTTVNATGTAIALNVPGTGGELNATVLSNQLLSPVGTNEIDATTSAGTLNLSAQGNAMDATTGTIRLNEIGGDFNVTQSATGIGSTNSIAPTNVIQPGGDINFLNPDPPAAPAP